MNLAEPGARPFDATVRNGHSNVGKFRLRSRVLLVVFLAVWGAGFWLTLTSVLRHAATSPVYVAAADTPNDYPTLTGFRAWFAEADPQLRPGDRLVRLGNVDLRGMGPVRFFLHFVEEAGANSHVPVLYERAGTPAATSLQAGSTTIVWPLLPVSLSFALAAVVLLVRARSAPMGRAFVPACMCSALYFASSFGSTQLVTATGMALHIASMTLAFPLFVRALLHFRQRAWQPHGWARMLPWVFLPLGPFEASGAYGAPLSPHVGLVGCLTMATAGYATLLAIGTWHYRHADPIERRQMKWGIFGLYCALVVPAASFAVAAVEPRFVSVALVSVSTLALGPIFLVIALTQYDVLDINRVISATASYNILLILLITATFMIVPRVAAAAAAVFEITPATGQLSLSLLLAAAIVPGQRRLRPLTDRLFFPERHALEHGTHSLLAELSHCQEPEDLFRCTGEALDALIRPEACVIYGRAGEAFAPVFLRGRVVPPAIEADGKLVTTLRTTRTPIEMGRWPRQWSEGSMADKAALESMGAVLLLPMRRSETLAAFVCLAGKRSGDIYTPTDLALLMAVTDAVSRELLRFADGELLIQAYRMQAALRRYVPGAVAAELESGESLRSAEREVSVLFVDIRGYTTYADGRQAEDIFSTVNRYTRVVSEIVRAHGGSVVEFNGDGMMAVFGAPTALAEKERAAVRAGRAIGNAMVAEKGTLASVPLSVGVGIATGPAFVGNIQAADRLIWTAIGNTTNLAARLQSLTRELEAAMVIDRTTWLAAGETEPGFALHEQVPIRGLRRAEDVYAWPLRSHADSTTD
jgi:class 3 adenylate cyclase